MPATGQQYRLVQYTTKDGLSHNRVSMTVKDQSGFLWIATDNGLNRFDGNRFTSFYHEPGNPLSLGHNFVHVVFCDSKGNIWACHNNGLSMFNAGTHSFTNYYPQKKYSYLSEIYWSITEDRLGRLWICNNNGLLVFDKANGSFTDLGWPAFLKQQTSTAAEQLNQSAHIQRGAGNTMWLKSLHNLFSYDVQTKQFTKHHVPALLQTTGGNLMYDDTVRKKLYAGTFNKGLLVYDYNNGQMSHPVTPAGMNITDTYDPIYNFQPLTGNVFVCRSDNHIAFFDILKQTYINFLTHDDFPNTNISCLLADSNSIWAGTEAGLLHLVPESYRVQQVVVNIPHHGAHAAAITSTPQLLYSSNYATPWPYVVNTVTGHAELLQTATGKVSGILRYVFLDARHNTWLSTETQVYVQKNGSNIWLPVVVQGDSSTTPLLPRNFIQDGSGNIWLRVRNKGLFRFNAQKNIFEFIDILPGVGGAEHTFMLFIRGQNRIWLSINGQGVYEVNPETSQVKAHQLSDVETALHPVRMSSPDGVHIWMNDPFNGLFKYSIATGTVTFFNSRNGLASNSCQTVEADATGNLWTFSTEGVSKVFAASGACTNMRSKQLNKIVDLHCSSDGKVYVATAAGIYWWYADSVPPPPAKPVLYLDKTTVMNAPADFTKQHVFAWKQNDITISYGALYYTEGQPLQYEYQLAGEAAWQSLGNRHEVAFSRLAPGSYQLNIRIKDEADSKRWLQTRWTIQKPFWATWWFRLLSTLLLAAAAYYMIKKRIRSIRQKARQQQLTAELKQQVAETEMAALRARMNPHFIFNCINSIDALVQEGDKYNATTYLNKFAKLIRNVLDSSRHATIPLSNDLDALRLYLELESFRMDHAFDYTIHIAPELLRSDVKVPSLIIQPYVENAILHGIRHLPGRRGKVDIHIEYNNDVLMYRITDNGVGRVYMQQHHGNKHTSHGMQITADRIRIFNHNDPSHVRVVDLYDAAGQPAGTEVTVTLCIN